MKKWITTLVTLTTVAALLAGCGAKAPAAPAPGGEPDLTGTISVNGSTSMEKVIGALSEQFMADHAGVKITYDPTGSGTGIEAVKNGTCDIGLSSRGLKDEETAAGLAGTNVALDGIAVIVNANSTVSDLTVEQITQIFTGAAADWSAVGGAAGPVAC
ncbi:MAG: substrate-binding domain-containing protein, partial [Oscillibacter sp.]